MAVGRPPFTGDSPVAVASKHVRDMPVLPREANPSVPPALEAVIMKAMAKNPDDRYGSAEELRADLLRFADGRPVEAGDPGLTSVMAAVGATQAVPMTTGRTMAVPPGGPPDNKEDLERKKRTRNLIILLVVLLVALAVIAFFLLRSVGAFGGNVSVPDVAKQTVAQATQTLQNANLTVGTKTPQSNSSVPAGEVVSTDPKAGASVAKNSTVNLFYSSGPVATAVVPVVTGKQLTQAIALLQGANLGYTIHNVTSNQPVGTVLDQNPAAGQKIPETKKVALTVSGTQTSVSVPSVVGQSPARAGSLLTQAGLTVGSQTTATACSTQPSGSVSAQSPGAGANEPPNTPINLVVSNGTCVTAPGVVGQSQSAATSAITGAGLVANTTFDSTCPNGAQPGNVDSQNPAASAQVYSGSTVNISVCQSATTTTTTTTTPTSSTTTSSTPQTPRATSFPGPGTGAADRPPAAPSGGRGGAELAEEIGQQGRARHGQDGLGMELHPLDAQGAVAQSHDHAVGRGGRDLQLVGHRVGLHHQRVVAGGDEGIGQAGEDALPVVVDLRGLAVHQMRGGHDAAAVGLADALVAQADAEQRDLPGQLPDSRQADPAVFGPARSR